MLNIEELRAFFAGMAGMESGEISDETAFFSSGVLDSFDLVRVLAFVEDKIGKRIRPVDINPRNFDTIARIVAFAENLAARAHERG